MGIIQLKDFSRNQLNPQKENINPFLAKTQWKKKTITAHDLKKTKEDTWKFFRKMGYIDSNRLYDNLHCNFVGWWTGEPCFIIGASKSLKGFINKIGWKVLDGLHTITINHVIEDYDRSECHFFLDKRFLNNTTYNMKNYKGIIFAQNNTGLKPSYNQILFYCNNKRPSTNFEDGLYCSRLSGLAALNLAIIMGADPIYLLGFDDTKKASYQNYHYKNSYTGETKTEKVFNKFIRVKKYFTQFKTWKNRINVVSDGEGLDPFKHVSLNDFSKELKQIKTIRVEQIPKIIHISFTNDINKHADITRHVIKNCFGNHKLVKQDLNNIPKADLYILEHFQSTTNFIKRFPYKQKAIDIVHTVNCVPDNSFKKIVVLTDAWRRLMIHYHIQNEKMVVINIGLNQELYNNILPDYDKKIFGRITRWSPGKVHPGWNGLVESILNEIPDSECLIYTNNTPSNQRPFLKHERMKYDNSCKINMFKGNFLKKMSVYVHANGSFVDTFSHGVLEAMSTGLPVVLLKDKIGAVEEVAGPASINCNNMQELKRIIIMLLNDKTAREEFGKKSKNRAKQYCHKRMVEQYNGVIKECLV